MPRKAKELPALVVSRLNEPGYHRVGGVSGLILQVTKSGARSWVLRVYVHGRRRDMGLGGFPDVTLARAREKAREIRELVDRGIDPIEERKREREERAVERAAVMSFDACVKAFLNSHQTAWKNEKHREQWASTLASYASPVIGQLPVNFVALPHIVQILDPIWREKPETASRLRGRIERVLAWATVRGFRSGDNPARWKGHLDALLPAKGAVRIVRHHAAVPIDVMPGFFAALQTRDGISTRALEFAIMTAARSGEVRGALWSEIDFATGLWTIPAERMKAKRPHIVPLGPRAVVLLRKLPRFAENMNQVFPSASGKVLSDMAMGAVLKRMNVEATVHGFRSTFKDWAAERTDYPNEVSELALAHTIGSKVEAAYRRGDLIEKRRSLMADWERFLTSKSNDFPS